MSDFGELRSLLQRPPEVGLFRTLTELLDTWPAHELRDTILPYTLDHIDPWRDHPWFKPPKRWKRALQRGLEVEPLRLFRRLDLRYLRVSIPWLSQLESLAKLQELDLSHVQLQDRDLEALIHASFAPSLRSLQLHGTRPPSLRHLRDARRWDNLRSLGLRNNGLTRSAMSLSNLDLPKLEILKLSNNALMSHDLPGLFGERPPPMLRSIDLEYNDFDADAYRALTSSPWWPQIRRLSIGLGPVDGSLSALSTFLRDGALADLEHLILCDHHIDNTCLSLLATCPHFTKLQHLGCGSVANGYARSMSRFDRAGVDALLTSTILQDSVKQAWRLPQEDRLGL